MEYNYYVNVVRPTVAGDYCDTNMRSTTNEVKYGGVSPKESNSIVGVTIPSINPEAAFDLFLRGLPNMYPIKDVCTLLFNFQKWTSEDIEKALDICTEHGFTVRYSENEYISHEVPFNLILEDTAHLMPFAKMYLSVDDDLMVLHKSPTIGKSGGTQYLEMIHYMALQPKCGYVSTSGTIARYPKRGYLGPHPKKGLNMYLQTGLGALISNMGPYTGCFLPYDSLTLFGALGDALSGAYRIADGQYTVKYVHIRVKHHGDPNLSDPDASPFGWGKVDLIENGVAKYIRDNYQPDYNWRSLHLQSFDKETYLSNGGPDIYDPNVISELTHHYPTMDDEDLDEYHSRLIDEILGRVLR